MYKNSQTKRVTVNDLSNNTLDIEVETTLTKPKRLIHDVIKLV